METKSRAPGTAEVVVSTALRVGVLVSVSFVLLGSVMSFVSHPDYLYSTQALTALLHPDPAANTSLAGLIAGLRRFDGPSVVGLGVVVLLATPVVRVALSIGIFTRERDRPFALITLAVLAILGASYWLGHR